jgi:CHAT domain-containing protein
MDRVVSSYTPTIRSLMHARRPRVPSGPGRHRQILVVAMPDTPGAPGLPGAAAEVQFIRQRFGDQAQALVGPEATYQAVITALAGARWAHFACHGSADLRDPSASYLLLADHEQHPLTVADIIRLRLEHADLVFLSACSTAYPGQRLTDEAIHLASAFQMAGYRHVIGTLWPIDDDSGTEITNAVYQEITGDWAAGKAAESLHEITLNLRNRLVAKPWLWASHIHSGV